MGQQKKPGLKRARIGCVTCKARRVKCDEGKPACARCIRFEVECEGYSNKVGNKKREKNVPVATYHRPLVRSLYPRQSTQSTIPDEGVATTATTMLVTTSRSKAVGGDINARLGALNRTESSNSRGVHGRSARHSPTSILGAGRVDPFRSRSVQTGPYDNELLDHCGFISSSIKNQALGHCLTGAILTVIYRQALKSYGPGLVYIVMMGHQVRSTHYGSKSATEVPLFYRLCSLEE
jgi:hypothetical protein